jgi:thiamine pyrophosphokinase
MEPLLRQSIRRRFEMTASDGPVTVVILTGGDPVPTDVLQDLPAEPTVIAADSGLDLALALGLRVDLIVGDLDSVTAEALAAVPDVPVERHPVDKDATDLELAMHAAARRGAERVMVVGGTGGRLDHALANAMLLASPSFAGIEIEWLVGGGSVLVVHGGARLHGAVGELVSLLAVGGPATGVVTEGLRWELNGETLDAGSTRGVSNRFLLPVASVHVATGTLLAVIPHRT